MSAYESVAATAHQNSASRFRFMSVMSVE
jgi:hypothetical protein